MLKSCDIVTVTSVRHCGLTTYPDENEKQFWLKMLSPLRAAHFGIFRHEVNKSEIEI